jgi:GAF domain-containing protein
MNFPARRLRPDRVQTVRPPIEVTPSGLDPQQGPSPVDVSSLERIIPELRVGILNNLTIGVSVLAIVAFLFYLDEALSAFSAVSEAAGSIASKIVTYFGPTIVYGVAILGLLLFTFWRRFSYPVRAAGFLIIVYTIGVNYATTGLLSDSTSGGIGILARFFILLFLPVFAGLLVEMRGAISTLVVSGATILVLALMTPSSVESLPLLLATLGYTSAGVFVSAAASIALIAFVRGLETILAQRQWATGQIERERTQLVKRAQESSVDLDRRLVQIRTAAEITRAISTLLDIDVLLPQVCELIKERFNLYYVGVFLLEASEGEPTEDGEGTNEYATLVAGTGDAGRAMIAAKHKLAVGGDSMIGWATANRQARIALDVGLEAVRFSNPYLPETRSELALPIMVQDQVHGAITVQSSLPAAFDEDDIIVLQGIADSLGSAIVNTRLFAELQERLEEIQTLHRHYLESAWTLEAREGLMYTFESAGARGSHKEGFIAGKEGFIARDEGLPDGEPTPIVLQLPIKVRDQVIGNLTLEADPDREAVIPGLATAAGWSDSEMSLIEAVATQAALALENARLLEETQRRAEQERVRASIASKVWASSDVDTIIRTALQELGSSLQAYEGVIQLDLGGEPSSEE